MAITKRNDKPLYCVILKVVLEQEKNFIKGMNEKDAKRETIPY